VVCAAGGPSLPTARLILCAQARAAPCLENFPMTYSIDLSGRVAFVTGASGGLGAQFARALARAGAGVVLASRRVEKLKDLRARIEGEGGDAHVVECDVTDVSSIKAAVAHAETEMGSIDILVNNSGVSTTQRLQDVGEDDYDFVFDTNVRGAFFVAQEVGKRMLARARGAAPGSFTGGRIINIASMAGLKVLPQIGVYCMSKAAVVQMTKAMALEWGRFGINVNAICPGYIDTEINHHHWQTESGKKLVSMLPRKRVGEPRDLDPILLMLASDQSHFINGAVIAADDGFAL
jgi:NAD(P)-dependent dehydrogenase (short-subunit alcohol dehydrogenase family)